MCCLEVVMVLLLMPMVMVLQVMHRVTVLLVMPMVRVLHVMHQVMVRW